MMAFVSIVLFFSCNNDLENVIKVSEFEKLPNLRGENINFQQTEYGKIVITISTPLIVNRTKDGEDIMEFPEGVTVVQYSQYPDTTSYISANYAINYTEKNLWEARGDIVAINAKNQEKLNTEYLVWDQKKGEISSNQKVQVSTPDDVIFGEGFRSDDSFNDWQVDKVTGIITFDGESYDEGTESEE